VVPARCEPLPGWPRGLREPLAAAYVGLSASTIRAEYAAGRFPAPVALTVGRQVWLRDDLDLWLDAKAGRAPAVTEEDRLR
jgi:predicted DNA-binding transcriptional regulator AlpA